VAVDYPSLVAAAHWCAREAAHARSHARANPVAAIRRHSSVAAVDVFGAVRVAVIRAGASVRIAPDGVATAIERGVGRRVGTAVRGGCSNVHRAAAASKQSEKRSGPQNPPHAFSIAPRLPAVERGLSSGNSTAVPERCVWLSMHPCRMNKNALRINWRRKA
jgi:hypothetical protein